MRGSRAHPRAILLAAGALIALAAPASAAPKPRSVTCQTKTVKVTSGKSVRLTLDCRVGRRWIARGAGVARSVVAKPAHGRLTGLDRRHGTMRYVPASGFRGMDTVRFALVRRAVAYRGTIRIRVVRAAAPAPRPTAPAPAAPARPQPDPVRPAPTDPAPTDPGPTDPTPDDPAPTDPGPTDPTPDDPAPSDGLPPQLPPAQPSYAAANWTPTSFDTCPVSVHERYSVIGPDGKRYPTWHPPTTTDPATGRTCTFGHEHGRDPQRSDIYRWVAEHLANPAAPAYAGIPFGLATESLDVYAGANPGTRIRHEDHVGYKADYENDVRLLAADGGSVGVTCDYLVSVHQGSHSPDAISNNVHELLYAVRCDDGTELISDTISRFGAPGQYTRACDPARTVTTTDNGYPTGVGGRSIPDRGCIEQTTLVPAGSTTSAWALYEKWSADNELKAADGHSIATYDSAFGVFDPSRYADASTATKIGRTLDLCWEVTPGGARARSAACDTATDHGSVAGAYAFGDPRSPFDGTHRDVYLRETRLDNAGGARLWWTDPYGEKGSTSPFPGALCQLVATVDTTARPRLQERVFGRNRPNDGEGVHAPN